MKLKIGIIGVLFGVALLIGVFGIQDDQTEVDKKRVFHATLASPENYQNGVFTESLQIEDGGDYEFDFVPNGDSPEKMTISLKGKSFTFRGIFELVGTPHQTSVSTYFTWDYSGPKEFQIHTPQELEIIIDPNGDVLGPVSVDIIRK